MDLFIVSLMCIAGEMVNLLSLTRVKVVLMMISFYAAGLGWIISDVVFVGIAG